ncbi:MAG: hypothetical protein U0802_16620 [Candidatus Binatia bacterium]
MLGRARFLLLGLVLGGCSALEPMNQAALAGYRQTCQSYGYQPGSVDFANCVERRAQNVPPAPVQATRGSQDQQKALIQQNQQLQQRNLELQQQNLQQQRDIQGQQEYEQQRQLYQQNQQYQRDLEARQEQENIENQVHDAADGGTGVGADDSPGSGGDIGDGTPTDEE